jgi:hypothetical protein
MTITVRAAKSALFTFSNLPFVTVERVACVFVLRVDELLDFPRLKHFPAAPVLVLPRADRIEHSAGTICGYSVFGILTQEMGR